VVRLGPQAAEGGSWAEKGVAWRRKTLFFLYKKTDFYFFSYLKIKSSTNKYYIKINKSNKNKYSGMNAFKHVSTLYLILFIFINYLIIV